MTELLISEAGREITLSEGGKPVTMTAGQAVLRSTLVSALKGNANAQRTFLQMTTTAQVQSAKNKREEYEAAVLMQLHVEVERNDWIRRGLDEADCPRHPLDIEINPQTGEVRSFLLYTRDAVEARERLIALRDYLIEKLPEMLDVAERDGDDALLGRGRERASSMIEMLNEQLPARLRRFLPHDVSPLSGTESPDEIWRTMAQQDASSLLNYAREGMRPARAPRAAKRSKPK